MATPHIAGLAAYLLSYENIKTSQLCSRIVELSLKSKIKGLPSNTVNYLAYNGAAQPSMDCFRRLVAEL